MTTQPILVTGATGDTGGYAIGALAKLDVSVRAMVRKDDERAARLRASGAGRRVDADVPTLPHWALPGPAVAPLAWPFSGNKRTLKGRAEIFQTSILPSAIGALPRSRRMAANAAFAGLLLGLILMARLVPNRSPLTRSKRMLPRQTVTSESDRDCVKTFRRVNWAQD